MIFETQWDCVFGVYSEIEWQADSPIGVDRKAIQESLFYYEYLIICCHANEIAASSSTSRWSLWETNSEKIANNFIVFRLTRLYRLRTFNTLPKMVEIKDCKHQIGRFVNEIHFYPPISGIECILGYMELDKYSM